MGIKIEREGATPPAPTEISVKCAVDLLEPTSERVAEVIISKWTANGLCLQAEEYFTAGKCIIIREEDVKALCAAMLEMSDGS